MPETSPSSFKFEVGRPTEVRLKYAAPFKVVSRGVPLWVYTTMQNQKFYAPAFFHGRIQSVNPKPGETLVITKRSDSDWNVARAGSTRPAPADSGRREERPARIASQSTPETRLAQALKTAVQAAASAEKFATELGYTCRFNSFDIRAMGISVLIGMENGGRR